MIIVISRRSSSEENILRKGDIIHWYQLFDPRHLLLGRKVTDDTVFGFCFKLQDDSSTVLVPQLFDSLIGHHRSV